MVISALLGSIVHLDLMKNYPAQPVLITVIRGNLVSQIAFLVKLAIITINKVNQAAANVVLLPLP